METDIRPNVHPGSLLLGLNNKDNDLLRQTEESEMKKPVPRKALPDRSIYLSRLMRPKIGSILLSDFKETRIRPGPHDGDIMPIIYLTPEVLLHIQWSYAIDIWSVTLTINLPKGGREGRQGNLPLFLYYFARYRTDPYQYFRLHL